MSLRTCGDDSRSLLGLAAYSYRTLSRIWKFRDEMLSAFVNCDCKNNAILINERLHSLCIAYAKETVHTSIQFPRFNIVW